jgi:hypothetical protein
MAFLPLIPQSTDKLSISQGNILNNFTILGAIAGNASAASASINSTSGFNWLYFPNQGATPPAGSSFPAGDVALYAFNNVTSTRDELYINKTLASGVAQIPSTASTLGTATPLLGTDGYTYLPSGLILKWGPGTANGSAVIAFAGPAFTVCLSVQLTVLQAGALDTDLAVRLVAITNANFTAWGSPRSTTGSAAVSFYYLAIGY